MLEINELMPQVEAMAAMMAGDKGQVALMKISPSRWQPRGKAFDAERLLELARSIRDTGLINPIVVFPVDGGYELVTGERRTRALIALAWSEAEEDVSLEDAVDVLAEIGLLGILPDIAQALSDVTVPARVEPADDLERLHQIAVIENLERENLSPLEEARAVHGLMEARGWTQRQAAERLGKSQAWVSQRVALRELPERAQEAVNTRVITISHTRALAAAPETIREPLAEVVVEMVEDGATTREVEEFTQEITNLLDPAQYDPADRRVYTPRERNQLAFLKWLVSRTDWNERYEALMKRRRLLVGLDPTDSMLANELAQVAGFESTEAAWRSFSTETNRVCQSCRWRGVTRENFTDGEVPCDRWTMEEGETIWMCRRWIGERDTVVIPFGCNWTLKDGFVDMGLPFQSLPFSHVTSLTAYLDGYDAVRAWDQEREKVQAKKRASKHVDEITEYWAWQATLEPAHLAHFQAHSCPKCAHYRPDSDPPCRFAGAGSQTPDFGALATRGGWLLPRCEMFAYANTPAIQPVVGCHLLPEQFRGWLRYVLATADKSPPMIWAVLRWLNCDHRQDYLEANWERLGGGEAMATLLDVAMSEAAPKVSSSWEDPVIRLIAPTNREGTEFVPVDIKVVFGERELPHWQKWPKGWKRPWLKS